VVAQNAAFACLAAAVALSALRVVTVKNVVHAALYLTVVLAGIAGLYILLAAEFIAVVQVLVYIGAIIVLLLFGVMLTRAPIGTDADLDNNQRVPSAIVALFLFGVLTAVLVDAFRRTHVTPRAVQGTAEVSLAIFSAYVVPFEVVSIVLLAALVGAVVIARRD
jgi:NADH-quinone oxidoreductase subunit J